MVVSLRIAVSGRLVSNDAPPSPLPTVQFELIEAAVRFIFSWVIMMPVSIILTGQLLDSNIRALKGDTNIFTIDIGIFRVQSSGSAVAFGFATFFTTFLIVTVTGGKHVYEWVQPRLGIDPGHFHTNCLLSALLSVTFGFLVHLTAPLFKARKLVSTRERDDIIERIMDSNRGHQDAV